MEVLGKDLVEANAQWTSVGDGDRHRALLSDVGLIREHDKRIAAAERLG